MKALVGAFNQEKALVGAFSVIVQPVVEPMEQHTALHLTCGGHAGRMLGHTARLSVGGEALDQQSLAAALAPCNRNMVWPNRAGNESLRRFTMPINFPY